MHARLTSPPTIRMLGAAVCFILSAASGVSTPAYAQRSGRGIIPPDSTGFDWEAGIYNWNFETVGYTDLNGNPAFKLAIQEVDGRWLLYAANFWVRGYTIVDVTDPTNPSVVKFVEGPHNTSTVQIDWVGNGLMETPLSRISAGRDFDPSQPYKSGFYMWDVSDPLDAKVIGHWASPGTHRNYYDGGRYVHAASEMDGYEGQIYVIVDASDPTNPVEAGRWWVPGQHVAGGEQSAEEGISLHGPPYPIGDLVYLPYGSAGMIILDISDVSSPQFVGKLDFSPPFKRGGTGVHGVLPLPDRGIAIANSEAGPNHCDEALNHASIVDISDPTNPVLISLFPLPLPPEGYPLDTFCDKGRFGPHNINHLQHSPFVEKQGNILYLTYFTAGLRAYDISEPRAPDEVGYFIPPDPKQRYGPRPPGALVVNTEDVLVDARGYAYISHRNQGIWIVRYTGSESQP